MDNEKQLPAGEIATQSLSGPDQTRRRLTGSALGVSAIFTLASRPVLAADCLTPSGFASGNLSHQGPPLSCSGASPATWGGQNASTYPGGNPKFKKVFANSLLINWGSTLLQDVMKATDNGNTTSTPNPISKEFAAALLNIRAGTYLAGITEVSLMGMWNEYATNSSYQVTAGSSWNASQIVAYLQYLRA